MTTTSTHQTLYRAPPVIGTESLSSWISRLALTQGCLTSDIRKLFDMGRGDCDLYLSKSDPTPLAVPCNLKLSEFLVIQRIMSELNRIDPNGTLYLLRDGNKSISRFCPLCLKSDSEPYFRLEWRFDPWRWCPLHNCLLEEVCPHCRKTVRVPFDLLNAGPKRQGAWNLSLCQSCGHSLTTQTPAYIDLFQMSSDAIKLLMNGRAFLAALYRGSFHSNDQREIALSKLSSTRDHGTAPYRLFDLAPKYDHLIKLGEYTGSARKRLRQFDLERYSQYEEKLKLHEYFLEMGWIRPKPAKKSIRQP